MRAVRSTALPDGALPPAAGFAPTRCAAAARARQITITRG
jgi:hypothetical protein